jgi:hypothetical protein
VAQLAGGITSTDLAHGSSWTRATGLHWRRCQISDKFESLRSCWGETEMNAIKFELDYFQIYDLDKRVDVYNSRKWVGLQDQLDEHREKARLIALTRFADRVSKNDEELFNKNALLTWYQLWYPPVNRPIWHLQITNQFSPEGQEILIREVVGLLVPARKRIHPMKRYTALARLDHYKVYRVIEGQPVDQPTVTLADQFGVRSTRVYWPVFFAVPVQKFYRVETPIINKRAHLTIYKVQPSRNLPKVIDTKDQLFTRRGLQLAFSYLLAVPSNKKVLRKE